MRDRCAVCKSWKGLKRNGPVQLCEKHDSRYIWDKEHNYLRQKNRGGKWDKIWPTQGNLARAIRKIGYEVDQEVMPLWSVSKKGALMPFDIAIPELMILVEYQGEQHQEQIKFFFRNKNLWKAYLKRQKLKRDLAEQNGWTVVEFTPDDKPFRGKEIKSKLMSALDGDKDGTET